MDSLDKPLAALHGGLTPNEGLLKTLKEIEGLVDNLIVEEQKKKQETPDEVQARYYKVEKLYLDTLREFIDFFVPLSNEEEENHLRKVEEYIRLAQIERDGI